jgi:predicted PurR-regulated permease PerM
MIESRAIALPPALILSAQLLSTLWLGTIGLLIATPLLVVVAIAVEVFYVQAKLREPPARSLDKSGGAEAAPQGSSSQY